MHLYNANVFHVTMTSPMNSIKASPRQTDRIRYGVWTLAFVGVDMARGARGAGILRQVSV